MQQHPAKATLITFIILYVMYFNTQNREHCQIIVAIIADQPA